MKGINIVSVALVAILVVSGAGCLDNGGKVYYEPTAKITVANQTILAGTTVEFDGSQSDGQGSAIIEYTWTFSGGETMTGVKVNKVVSQNATGQLTVFLKVVNEGHLEDTATMTLTITTPIAPVVKINGGSSDFKTLVGVNPTVILSASDSVINRPPATYKWTMPNASVVEAANVTYNFTGETGSRLFKLNITDSTGYSITRSWDFLAIPVNSNSSVFIEDPAWIHVKMNTTSGDIVLRLFKDKAPVTVENFRKYVADGFYNGLVFHRVIKNFMDQGGGFNPDGSEKSPTYPAITNEASSSQLRNTRGTIAMARTTDPNSATCQFFINLVDNGFLDWDQASDSYGYCAFGEIVGTFSSTTIDTIALSGDYNTTAQAVGKTVTTINSATIL